MNCPQQLDLFPRQLVLRWLPDETLFSLCSRYHRLSGEVRPNRTTQRLFGSNGGIHADFASHLDEFVRRTERQLGDAESILEEHTIVPFFLALAGRGRAQYIRRMAMFGGRMSELKSRIGLLGGISAAPPLKYCEICAADDRAAFGTPYWHRTHQLPSSLVCLKHSSWLLHQVREEQRLAWTLPKGAEHAEPVEGPLDEVAIALGRAGASLLEVGASDELSAARLAATHEREIAASGLPARSAGRREVADEFRLYLQRKSRVLPFFKWTGRGQVLPLVHRIFDAPETVHPVKHLLFIVWLYGGWDRFAVRYQVTTSLQSDLPMVSTSRARVPHRAAALLHT